ncbi:MAG: 6-carboxytetrahydropterin synthase [Bacteroidales bacterium]|nr:6-carboxytetrahydropterin synthase [Bacteroidales bacterium]
MIRITKAFNFEMAHALKDHEGACRNIHGHTYELFVTIIGEPKAEDGHPANGMIMDFKDLKEIVNKNIVKLYDHAFVVSERSPWATDKGAQSCKLIVLPFEPTSENLVAEYARILNEALPSDVKLHSLRLRETTTAYAEWFASDNQ